MSSRIAISLGASFLGYATHAGFLARLHELGVRPVAVGGSSAGAVAAGLYASGLPPEKVREVVTTRELRSAFIRRTPWFTHYIRSTFFDANPGLFKTDAAVTYLESILGDVQIENLKSPSYLAAVSNLETHQAHFLQSGSLAKAMVASCCVPTVFQPLQHAGMICYDGGVAHETPMDPWLEDAGVDTIILHRVSHTGGKAPQMVPFNLINLTARSHACASEQLLSYRLKLAEMHNKKVILITTTHERPALLSSKQMPSFYEAGAASAQKLFESDLPSLL